MNDKQRRKKGTEIWLRDTDPIRLGIYQCLICIKYFLIALFVYLTILSISEGVFTLQNARDHAVGHIYVKPEENIKQWQLPKMKIKIVLNV